MHERRRARMGLVRRRHGGTKISFEHVDQQLLGAGELRLHEL